MSGKLIKDEHPENILSIFLTLIFYDSIYSQGQFSIIKLSLLIDCIEPFRYIR